MDEVNYSLDTTVSSCPSSLRHAHNVMYVPYWLHSILIVSSHNYTIFVYG